MEASDFLKLKPCTVALLARVYNEQVFSRKFSFTSFICSWVVCTTGQVFLNDDVRSEQWRNAKFIVQFSLPAVHTNNFSFLKPGMISFWTRLLVKENLSVNLYCAHEKIKLLKGRLVLRVYWMVWKKWPLGQ